MDPAGRPFRTDDQGYLQGRGEIGPGDRLLALAPVHTDVTYAGALAFDGGEDRVIRTPLHNAPVTATTVSFWMRSDDTTGSGTPLSYATSSNADEFLITNYNDFAIHRGGSFVTTGITTTDGAWHHIVMTRDSATGEVQVFVNGAWNETATSDSGDKTTPFNDIGRIDDTGGSPEYFDGRLDEVRILDIVVTDDWVAAQFLSQTDASFVGFGGEENAP